MMNGQENNETVGNNQRWQNRTIKICTTLIVGRRINGA